MKNLLLIFLISCLSTNEKNAMPQTGIIKNNYLISLIEAGRILGETVHLKENRDSSTTTYFSHKSIYKAGKADAETPKTGNLYYVFERYHDEAGAKKVCDAIELSNRNYAGWSVLDRIGDQAYFHTDKHNFCLIVARKGNKVIRMKVNKLTSTTSVQELKSIAGDVIARI